MIEVKKLTKKYGDRTILSDISFRVEEETVFGIMGKNGIGKTTLIESLIKKRKHEGEVVLSENLIRKNGLIDYSNLYYVNDSPHSYDYLTGLEYIYFVLRIKNKPLPAESDILELLQVFGIDSESENKLMITYSFGMRRKIILALGFLIKPDLMVLDEPTIGLDVPSVIALKKMILMSSRNKQTFIISSHEPSVISELCDALMILHESKVAYYNENFKNEQQKLDKLYMNIIGFDIDKKINSILS